MVVRKPTFQKWRLDFRKLDVLVVSQGSLSWFTIILAKLGTGSISSPENLKQPGAPFFIAHGQALVIHRNQWSTWTLGLRKTHPCKINMVHLKIASKRKIIHFWVQNVNFPGYMSLFYGFVTFTLHDSNAFFHAGKSP